MTTPAMSDPLARLVELEQQGCQCMPGRVLNCRLCREARDALRALLRVARESLKERTRLADQISQEFADAVDALEKLS